MEIEELRKELTNYMKFCNKQGGTSTSSMKEQDIEMYLDSIVKNRDRINFAMHCMTELLSTHPENSEYSEISGLDLSRIDQVLRKYE